MQKYKNIQAVKEECQSTGSQLVVFRGGVYDVKDFAPTHPGEPELINSRIGTDITQPFEENGHSSSALSILHTLQIGKVENYDGPPEVSHEDDPKEKLRKRVHAKVDLSKGLLAQITKLTKEEYIAFIEEPKHQSEPKDIILFDSPFLEMWTKTPWYEIPLVWLPVVWHQIYTAIYDKTEALGTIEAAISVVFGIFLWSLIEYLLHRFLFHSEDELPENNGTFQYAHFLIHGVHHAFPMDRYRLVFPILPGLSLGFLIYQLTGIVRFFLPPLHQDTIFAGIIIGYVCYDMIHYYVHHSKPSVQYLRNMKSYHMKHHYKNNADGFGISNKIWDYAFGTVLK